MLMAARNAKKASSSVALGVVLWADCEFAAPAMTCSNGLTTKCESSRVRQQPPEWNEGRIRGGGAWGAGTKKGQEL